MNVERLTTVRNITGGCRMEEKNYVLKMKLHFEKTLWESELVCVSSFLSRLFLCFGISLRAALIYLITLCVWFKVVRQLLSAKRQIVVGGDQNSATSVNARKTPCKLCCCCFLLALFPDKNIH